MQKFDDLVTTNHERVVSAHQVHYLPWLGYCYKIAVADKFVLADNVQYKSHNYINRTRIKNATGDQWLTVPVLTKGRQTQLIKDVKINPNINWRRKHWMALQVNYRSAPYFDMYADFFDRVYQKEWNYLIDLNLATIHFMIDALKIKTKLYLSSELRLKTGRTERIVDMAMKLECDRYLSGPTGKKYMNMQLFEEAGITVDFLHFEHPTYHQQFEGFSPYMSIVDLLFNEGEGALGILLNQIPQFV